MDIYQPDAADTRTVDGATAALSRAAGRIVLSIIRSIQYLKPAAVEHLENLISPASLWVLGIILAGWVIATVIGGPIALVINTLLGVYGLYQLYEQLAITWQNLRDWAQTAYRAKNDNDLDKASRYFAQAVTDGGLAFIEILIAHRIFKSVEGNLRKRYPAPEWVKAEFEKAMEARKKTSSSAKPGEAEPKRTTPTGEPEPKRQVPPDEAERVAERRRRFEGERGPTLAPPPLPPGGDSPLVYVVGGVVAVALVTTAGVLISRSSK